MPSHNVYLYAVQGSTGREIVSASVEVEKVTDVTARISEVASDDFDVELVFEDIVLDSRPVGGDRPTDLVLLRWPADDKLSTPVRHAVK